MNYGFVLDFAFSWRKGKAFLKYCGLVWLLYILFLLSILTVAVLLFRDLFISLFSGSFENVLAVLAQPSVLGAMAVSLFFAAIPVCLFFCLLCFFVQALMQLFSLRKADLGAVKFDLRAVFMLFFIAVVGPIVALFSLFNKRMLLLPVIASIFALAALGPSATLSAGSAGLSAVLFLGYSLIVVYNLVRLSFAATIFLNKGGGLSQALKASWLLSKGRAWQAIFPFVAVAFVVSLALLIAFFAVSAAVSLVLFALVLPSFLLSLAVAVIFALVLLHPLKMLCYSFAWTAVYEQLLEERR